eukprot:6205849-Pleurochrysis_carterae.AAC.1
MRQRQGNADFAVSCVCGKRMHTPGSGGAEAFHSCACRARTIFDWRCVLALLCSVYPWRACRHCSRDVAATPWRVSRVHTFSQGGPHRLSPKRGERIQLSKQSCQGGAFGTQQAAAAKAKRCPDACLLASSAAYGGQYPLRACRVGGKRSTTTSEIR